MINLLKKFMAKKIEVTTEESVMTSREIHEARLKELQTLHDTLKMENITRISDLENKIANLHKILLEE